jgi:hypothetical protein
VRILATIVLALLLLAAPAAPSGDSSPAKADAKADATGKAGKKSFVERAREAVKAGVAFLLKTQNKDGSWGRNSQRSPYKIYCPVPGGHRSFRGATTALVLMALLEAPGDEKRLKEARKRGMAWLIRNAKVKRSHGRELYNCWSHGYGLKCIARYLAKAPTEIDVKAARATAAELVKDLARWQVIDGGWGYFDFQHRMRRPSGTSMSFTTATVLLALKEAEEQGIRVPGPIVKKAIRCLQRSRTVDGNFIYSSSHRFYPHGGINRPQGALTRNPGCHYALYRFGVDSGKKELRHAVRNLLEKKKFARLALHRPRPHESWFAVSGYFYLYGYAYAVESLGALEPEFVGEVRDGLIEEVLLTHHPDGSFWDYPLYGYHKPYGTGYALLALLPLTARKVN